MPPPPSTLAQRFQRHATGRRHGSQCILWEGKLDRQGYGLISVRSHNWGFAHRAAWFLHHGVWPAGVIMHACDVRNCVNIEHLSEGTHADNVVDAIRKGRMDNRGEKHGMSKLTDAQAREIRDRYAAGGVSQEQLGREYGVAQATVSYVCRRLRWRHV